MTAFRVLVIAGALVAYALAMLGSWTRINSAGMTCPDWPLCHGAVVPLLHGRIVLEWLHRMLAFFETFVVAALIVTGWRLRSAIPILGGMLAALGAVFVLQVLLGGATIFLANSPLSVMFHFGTAMLLLTALASLAVVAFTYEPLRPAPAFAAGRPGTAGLLVATGLAFATICAGAYVSTSGAGLACPSVPGCGPSFLGETHAQALQMIHRLLAAALAVFAITAAVLLPRAQRRATTALRIALGLLALQVTLGILNVVWLLPTALREAHAANAIVTFLCLVVATAFASLDAAAAPLFVPSSKSFALPQPRR